VPSSDDPSVPFTRLTVHPWVDPVVDQLGFDPRSPYVERFWLRVLGPSSICLLRHLAQRFDHEPEGFSVDVEACASAIGLGASTSPHAPFGRTIGRLCQFGMAQRRTSAELWVRRQLPPLGRHHLARLPDELRASHDRWQLGCLDPDRPTRRSDHARLLALALVELGSTLAEVAAQLELWGHGPQSATDASNWAWSHHHGRAALRRPAPTTVSPRPRPRPSPAPAGSPTPAG